MNTYKVTITETLTKTILVDAEDKNDAYDKVCDAIESDVIALTEDDFQCEAREITVGGKAKGHDFYCYDSLEELDGYDELIGDYIEW